ncbi:MAG: 50S ribosomal protein L17 [Chitinophagaceae bacterium]|nr:50S ribosomal protein L17 [Chitinophagaceae bacterium]
MRHGDKINNLSRTASHRKALLSNLANALLVNKRIVTTLAKAKALRTYIEPLITKTKKNDSKEQISHNHRLVFSQLQNKEAVKELFTVIAPKVAGRPGGYTRIIKLGKRVGDNAETALIELVDFNEVYIKGTEKTAAATTKRTRRAGGKKKAEAKEEAAAETTAAETIPPAEEAKAE